MKKHKRGKWRYFLFFLFFLWTCILVVGIAKRYVLTKTMENDLVNMIMKKNLMHIGILTAVERSDAVSTQIYRGSHSIRYAAEENEYIETKEEKESKKEEKETQEVIQTSNIILFNNGSADITAKNKSVIDKERKITDTIKDDPQEMLVENNRKIKRLQSSNSRSYLLKNFYITDSTTSIDRKIFQVKELLHMDLTLEKKDKPQILILHTHGASEAFIDSKKGTEDSIIGVGALLAKILSDRYGYQVIHDKTEYDKINGEIDRNKAYNKSLEGAKQILKKYPSIDLIIDLHRDGVGNRVKRTTVLDGKRTAQVMFFNGLSRNSSGDIDYLKNPNLQANLSFSLQLKLACMKHFKDFAKPVYLKGYRYNMHLKKRYTLIELGNENNTVAEAKNAAAPLALVIHEVLSGDK